MFWKHTNLANLASSYGVQYGCRYMTIYGNACLDMTIDGNATNGGNMTIYGINKHMIMRGLTAYCPSNGDCIISCHDTYACAYLNVHCPSGANCIISCHDTNACYGGDFFAHPNARLLSIQCGAHYAACDSLYIRCPDRHPNVDYNCILNASGSFSNVDIYSINNKVLLQGSSSSTTLHCGYEWYDECDLGTVNGEWQCEDISSVCNQLVTITSSIWTYWIHRVFVISLSRSHHQIGLYHHQAALPLPSGSPTTAIPTTNTHQCPYIHDCLQFREVSIHQRLPAIQRTHANLKQCIAQKVNIATLNALEVMRATMQHSTAHPVPLIVTYCVLEATILLLLTA
eukprot:1164296_1